MIAFIIFLLIVAGVWLVFGGKAAGKTILITLLVVFVGFVGLIIWIMHAYPSNPPAQPTITSPSSDSFPYDNADEQYTWYDSHNVAMSNRCYTTMNPPCTDSEWEQATGSIPPSGTLAPIPSAPSASTNSNTVPFYSGTGGTFYLTVPRGNNSTCTWTWVAGSGAIPYSQTTFATAGEEQIITVPGSDGSTIDNFKVTCVDDFGDQYTGVPAQ